MAKINVLYLVTKATAGGAQKYIYDLASNLPKDRFDIIVAYGERGKLAKDLALAGIKLHEIRALGRDIALLSDMHSFLAILRMLRELRPDILHLNSSKAAGLGVLAARIAGIRTIVFTVHGWPFKEGRSPFVRILIYIASWLTAILSDQIIVISSIDLRLARKMWFIRKKVYFIPLGIEPFSIQTPDDGYRTMFGQLEPAKIGGPTLRLASIGELTANKGFRYAIEAMSLLRERAIDAVYVIAGDGEERDALLARAEKCGIGDRVFFPGFIPQAARNLSGFDLFILPSVKEGTPYVLLEAVRAGIHIVATNVVDDEFAAAVPSMKLVKARDPQALADAIASLSHSPRAKSDQRLFSLSEMVQKTTALYLKDSPMPRR